MATNHEHTSTTIDSTKHERQLQSILPFYNVTKRLSDALVSIGSKTSESKDISNDAPEYVKVLYGIDGAHDLMRLSLRAKNESESSDYQYFATESENIFLQYMNMVADKYNACAKLDHDVPSNIAHEVRQLIVDQIDSINEDDAESMQQLTSKLESIELFIFAESNQLAGDEAHSFMVAAERVEVNPGDAYARADYDFTLDRLKIASKRQVVLRNGYDVIAEYRSNDKKEQNVDALSYSGLDQLEMPRHSTEEQFEVNEHTDQSQPEAEHESVRLRTELQIAKEAIKAVVEEEITDTAENIEESTISASDVDEDDLFAAMQHDFKDFIPSPEMQANEDFGGVLTERGRELLAKDRQVDDTETVKDPVVAEGQEWFDAMNESFDSADQDKSVEAPSEPQLDNSQDDEMIEALREMGQLDEVKDEDVSKAEDIEQIEVARQEESSHESVEIADEIPESLEQAKLDKRRKKAAKTLGKLTKSIMLSVDKKELRRATKRMKKLNRKLNK